jgi:hypothetical protein
MKKFYFSILTLLICIGSSVFAASEKAPFTIKITTKPNPLIPQIMMKSLYLTSVVNSVTIDKVIVNRGNCNVMYEFNRHAQKFGETVYCIIEPSCTPIEINVETVEHGAWTFNMKQ